MYYNVFVILYAYQPASVIAISVHFEGNFTRMNLSWLIYLLLQLLEVKY